MKDIDGYVTKDELYRLISRIKRNPDVVVDDKTCHTIVNAISDIPAADVQPVKRGKWIENTYKYIKELDAYFVQAKCTVCGRYSDKIDIYTGYMSNECCSHCGAKMDGDTNE